MDHAAKSFAQALREGLGIVVRCDGCHKRITFRCQDFDGYIRPEAEIERLTWRCTLCRNTAAHARYTALDRNDREGLAQWLPPPGRKPLRL